MKYQYNFAFLSEWMEANNNIPKGAIQQAIGAMSNNGLKSWVRGERPMPVMTMLRFCNTFQVPMSMFFRNVDADAADNDYPHRPDGTEHTTPLGGFAEGAGGRARGERTILDPTDVQVIRSVVPGLPPREDTQDVPVGGTEVHVQTNAEQVGTIVGNVSDANMSAIVELERKNNERQEQLLDIIAEQQRQIADLTNRLLRMQDDRHYDSIGGYGMVAEDLSGRSR